MKLYLHWRNWHPTYTAIVLMVVFFCISLLPSLLPRPWWVQGVVTGISMASGYGIGLGLSALTRWLLQYEHEPMHAFKRVAWYMLRFAGPLMMAVFLLLGRSWQIEVRALTGIEDMMEPYILLVILIALPVFALLILLGRFILWTGHKFRRFYQRKAPPRLGVALGILTTFLLFYFIASGLFTNAFIASANNVFSAHNQTVPPGIEQPDSGLRSGSPESLISWDDIGYQGRQFVGRGPSAEDIESYHGSQAAEEPIRLYTGLLSAESAEERAELTLDELERTGAFEREVLVIANATGTGWLEPTAMDAIEYMYNGDTAIVSQQYSYLPSWISFLVDQEHARETGRALYDALIEEWLSRPEAERPQLITYGLSLGSYGGQSVFSGVNDIRRSVDGALFVGTPYETELWQTITENREPGSPQWQPEYRSGESVHFASSRDDILHHQPVWDDGTRILYMQHASDPVVWFSSDLLFNKPDWLDEERGPDISSNTRWYPIVTFLQVGLDIMISAPPGHGHEYKDTAVHAWTAVLPPEDWSVQDSDALQHHLRDRY